MSTGRENISVDLDQPYESNVIGLKSIIYFSVGLFLFIVVTFGLMWIFQYKVLEEQALKADKREENPLALSTEEKLPPEPRLQAAPGFGVYDKGQRINLELREPQAEYREMVKQWKRLWEEGEKEVHTKTIIALPIEEAKKKLLEGKSIKIRSGEKGKESLKNADFFVSTSSSGRLKSEKARR